MISGTASSSNGPSGTDELREQIRDHYARAARAVTMAPDNGCCADTSCCGGSAATQVSLEPGLETSPFGAGQYADADRDQLPAEAVAASLGCGNPLAVAALHDGETVLDLGSGGGIDVLLSARRVGPTGTAYGLDMTDEMLDLARSNAAVARATNVEFLKGEMEAIPLADACVDVVISNCVINLSTDKPAVFAETFRVLRPGGRLGVSDVVAEDHLTPADRAARGNHVGCVAGCLSLTEYRDHLTAAGFTNIEITPTHPVADGIHSAIVHATKPAEGTTPPETS